MMMAGGCAPIVRVPTVLYTGEPKPGGVLLYVAPDGDDAASGDAAHPLATVAAALRLATPGSVIRLTPGVYRERVEVTFQAREGAPLVIEGARTPDGQWLARVDGSTRLDPKRWQPRPEIGPGVYAYPMGDPHLMLVNGENVPRLHWDIRHLGRSDDHPKGHHVAYRAEEILASREDRREVQRYHAEAIPFWETVGGVYSPSRDLKEVYLRLAGGGDPRKMETAAALEGAVVTLRGARHVVLRDLAIGGGEYGVEILGEGTAFNRVEQCYVTHGRRRIKVGAGARQTVIAGNRVENGFIGQLTGAWGTSPTDSPAQRMKAAQKCFVYIYFKYWASAVSISDDVSIIAEKGSVDTLIEKNSLEGGLIGIGLYGGDRVRIANNTVRHFSSVGTVVRDGGDLAVYDGNLFEDCNINIRLHTLSTPGQQRRIALLRNVSIQRPGVSAHIFCHSTPFARDSPVHRVVIAQNTFVGGNKVIGFPPLPPPGTIKPLSRFQFVNNRFIGCGTVIHAKMPYFENRDMFGHFDYNQIIGGRIGVHGVPVWYGAHNIDDTQASGWKIDGDRVTLPTPDRGRRAGLDLSQPYELDGERYPSLGGLMPGYVGDPAPDLGAPWWPPSQRALTHAY
ncbi:MAG TPA: hypothetical protein VNQ90_13375 [Chthoniobacteraceae bacterium]|nr:hypothetical protein [Chthoniobacteraceae bacterium]